MNLHSPQDLVGCARPVRAGEGVHKVVPRSLLGLLEVTSGAGMDRCKRFEQQGRPRT